MLTITQAETEEQIASARELFREYERWLEMDLCFQGFEAELAGLPGSYAEPGGRLLLAYADGDLAGCVALRALSDDICEMKRLFVRSDYRGHKVGIGLIERLIDEATSAGYSKMRLDTFPPKMAKAVALYKSLAFVPIDPYYDNPHDGVVYMERNLP